MFSLITDFAPDNPAKMLEFKEMEAAARVLRATVKALHVRTTEDVDAAFASAAKDRFDAVVILVDGVTLSNRQRIVELAAKNQLPAMYQVRDFVNAGGLVSYSLNFCQHFQRAATYVDKILKGAKPADLPVELPTTFELVINLKAAKAIGLTVPPLMVIRADAVIE